MQSALHSSFIRNAQLCISNFLHLQKCSFLQMQKSIFLYIYIRSLLMELVKLFVGGFPLVIDELELAKLFGPHGDISTIKIVRDKKTRICKGYAFI